MWCFVVISFLLGCILFGIFTENHKQLSYPEREELACQAKKLLVQQMVRDPKMRRHGQKLRGRESCCVVSSGGAGCIFGLRYVELVIRFLCTHLSKVNIKGNMHF